MGMSLSDEMRAVISNLEAREWIQNDEIDGDAVCAHGAVKTCEVLRPGDEQIIRAVMRRRGLTEDWNDTHGRTKAEVLTLMRQIEVFDGDLADTFGPNWRLVVAVVRRAAVLTTDEALRLVTAQYAVKDDASDTAWHATWNAARNAARTAALSAAWPAAWAAAKARAAATAKAAALAVTVADLVGQHGLIQDHIDTLMKPWTDVLGDNWAEGMLP